MASSPTATSLAFPVEGAEPVSPELVLVDPELAQIERARLMKAADSEFQWRFDRSTRSHPAEAGNPRSSSARRPFATAKKPLLLGALFVAMFAGGIYVSRLVMHERASASEQVVTMTSAAQPLANPASNASGSSRLIPVSAAAAAERAILSRMVQSGKRNLPSRLVDSATGLLKNNVHTRCRRSRHSRSFLCVIQSPARPAREGLYVRYWPRRHGHASFAWYGYRDG